MQDKEEIWKDIKGHEGLYRISSLGRVQSLPRNTANGRMLKPAISANGYRFVQLSKNGARAITYIHKLVAISFLNHIRNGYQEVVDHINGIKSDNRIENLRLVTQQENVINSRKIKTSKYLGVSWNKFRNKWCAIIRLNGIQYRLGYYQNEMDADKAYKEAEESIKAGTFKGHTIQRKKKAGNL